MALFKIFRGTSENLPSIVHDGYAYLTTDDGKFYVDTKEKRILINPDTSSADKISYLQDGIMTDVAAVLDSLLDTSVLMEIHTSQEWADSAGRRISEKGTFYVYTDAYQTQDEQVIPRIKIGDGLAYICDLPFMDDAMRLQLLKHIQDLDVHVTPEQKLAWWNKLNVDDNEEIIENTLMFNRN